MRLDLKSIFPDIPHFKEVNLNDWLKAHCPVRPDSPDAYQVEIHRLNKEAGMPTYGGWMEYREWMWSDSYMRHTQKYVHLGIDVYLPCPTPVQFPFPVTVIDTFYDEDCDVGWGGRITVQRTPRSPAIVLGHLEKEMPSQGITIPANHPISHIATWPINGNVFDHLHIQLIRPELLPTLDWEELDGYGYKEQSTDFPHPLLTDI